MPQQCWHGTTDMSILPTQGTNTPASSLLLESKKCAPSTQTSKQKQGIEVMLETQHRQCHGITLHQASGLTVLRATSADMKASAC